MGLLQLPVWLIIPLIYFLLASVFPAQTGACFVSVGKGGSVTSWILYYTGRAQTRAVICRAFVVCPSKLWEFPFGPHLWTVDLNVPPPPQKVCLRIGGKSLEGFFSPLCCIALIFFLHFYPHSHWCLNITSLFIILYFSKKCISRIDWNTLLKYLTNSPSVIYMQRRC